MRTCVRTCAFICAQRIRPRQFNSSFVFALSTMSARFNRQYKTLYGTTCENWFVVVGSECKEEVVGIVQRVQLNAPCFSLYYHHCVQAHQAPAYTGPTAVGTMWGQNTKCIHGIPLSFGRHFPGSSWITSPFLRRRVVTPAFVGRSRRSYLLQLKPNGFGGNLCACGLYFGLRVRTGFILRRCCAVHGSVCRYVLGHLLMLLRG